MAISTFNRKFKFYLEGIRFPFVQAITISTVKNHGSTADITFNDDGQIVSNFFPGVHIAVFFLPDSLDSFEKKQTEEYLLLFEGVGVDVFSNLNDRARTLTIKCYGFSYYSKQAKYYFHNSINSSGSLSLNVSSGLRVDTNGIETTRIGKETVNDTYADPGLVEAVSRNSARRAVFDSIFNEQSESFRSSRSSSKEEKILQNCFYRFAYFGSSANSIFREVYKSIFDSVNLPSKVWSAFDGKTSEVGGIFPMSMGIQYGSGNGWFQRYLENVIGSITPFGNYFDIFSYFLANMNYSFVENLAPSFAKDQLSGPVISFFKPDVFYSVPPKCNVIFPKDIDANSGISFTRNFSSEPTVGLFISQVYAEQRRAGLDQANNTLFENLLTPVETSQVETNTFIDARRWPNSEKLSGIIPSIHDFSSYINLFRFDGDPTGNNLLIGVNRGSYVDASKKKASIDFWKNYYGSRGASVKTIFNPALLCGHSCVVLDKYYSIVGNINSITHTLTPRGSSTMISLEYVRLDSYANPTSLDSPLSFFDGVSDSYNGYAISKIYSSFFGTEMIASSKRSFGDPKNPVETLEMVKRISKDLFDEYYAQQIDYRNSWADSFKKRSYTTERDFFTNLGLPSVNQGIEDGYFEGVERTQISSGKPFSIERQNFVNLYISSLAFRATVGE